MANRSHIVAVHLRFSSAILICNFQIEILICDSQIESLDHWAIAGCKIADAISDRLSLMARYCQANSEITDGKIMEAIGEWSVLKLPVSNGESWRSKRNGADRTYFGHRRFASAVSAVKLFVFTIEESF